MLSPTLAIWRIGRINGVLSFPGKGIRLRLCPADAKKLDSATGFFIETNNPK
jgi:hypothetical protein